MPRWLRTLLTCLLALALPVQAWAAASMAHGLGPTGGHEAAHAQRAVRHMPATPPTVHGAGGHGYTGQGHTGPAGPRPMAQARHFHTAPAPTPQAPAALTHDAQMPGPQARAAHGPHHGQPATTAAPAERGDAGDHDRLAAASPAVDGGQPAAQGDAVHGHAVHGKCSACAACCGAVALPAAAPSWTVPVATQVYRAAAAVWRAGHIPAGDERPPRAAA